MPRQKRPVITISLETGERKEYASAYACANAIGAKPNGVISALETLGTCKGYRILDVPETIRKRIVELENVLNEYYGQDEF